MSPAPRLQLLWLSLLMLNLPPQKPLESGPVNLFNEIDTADATIDNTTVDVSVRPTVR